VLATALVAAISFQTAHARGAPSQAQASGDAELPDAPGRAVVLRVCTMCHGVEFIVPSERTVQVWKDTLEVMRGYGAEASDEDWKTITDYLIVNLAHLNVNEAAAEEIGLVFAVNEKIAQGVVAYRDKQGGFKTIEDLKKAPDLDPKKIDALKPRLIFE
jgi:competence protein ComEA